MVGCVLYCSGTVTCVKHAQTGVQQCIGMANDVYEHMYMYVNTYCKCIVLQDDVAGRVLELECVSKYMYNMSMDMYSNA